MPWISPHALAAVALVGGAVVSGCGAQAVAPTRPAAQPANASAPAGDPVMSVDNMRVYHGDGFNISAPSDFAVVHQYPAPGPDQSVLGVAFVVPTAMTTGTNLADDSYIAVEMLPGAGACVAGRFVSNAQPVPPTSVGQLQYSVATDNEGAMGSYYEETVFALANHSPCLAVAYFIHSHNIGFYDPGTVRAFDRRTLVAKFDTIRRSLVLTK